MDVVFTLRVSAVCLLVAALWPVCLGQDRYENVALNKQCTMNTTWSGPPHNTQPPRDKQLAVNGDTKGGTKSALPNNNCVHSGYGDRNTYWEVNLGRRYPLHRMISYGRDSYAFRMSNITVTVNDQLCYTYPPYVSELKTELTCSSVLHGDKVRLTKVTPSGNDYTINLCEFQVYSCKDPFWGDQCQHDCGQCRGQEVCDKVTGVCTSCKPGWNETQPKYCTEECDPGTYGDGCGWTCSSNCNPSNVCHHVDGHCPCSPGWKPGTCDTACDDGHYGQNCTGLCGQGCSQLPCDKTDGRCSCSPGWVPPFCQQECQDGRFGQNCGSNCSAHCVGVCNKKNGTCTCDLGYQPPKCELPCPDGRFGQNCLKECSANCQHTCNKQTGHCTCKPGWRGDLCDQECQPGWYGPNCSEECGRCRHTTCHHVDGACTSCLYHFATPLCKECQDYYHGDDCSLSCSENCQSGTPCDKSNGHCPCKEGWEGVDCTQACSPGMYGAGCQFPCGNCSTDGPACHHINGTCLQGCQQGFQSALCNIPVAEKKGGAGGDDNTGVIAGAVVGVLAIAAIAGVVIVIWRRRNSQAGRTKESEAILVHNNTVNSSSNTTADNVYQNVTLDISTHTSATYQAETTKPVAAVKPEKKKGDKSLYPNMSDGATPSTSSPPSTSAAEVDTAEAEGLDDVTAPPDAYYNDDTYMTSEAAGLGLDGVQQSLLNKLRGKAFVGEFKKLEVGLTRSHDIGSAQQNYYRNRFRSIVPYDDNRVILRDAPHEDANDYINASYIRGWNSDKAYIASQGPRENTVSDMWWMVWQLNLSHIVMLTSCVEREKRKCEEYWPAQGKQRKYGVIYVTTVNTQVRADYVIRTFTVKSEGGTGGREVKQYHFVTWQDHDVPTVTSLVDFWLSVSRSYRKQQPKAPLLVHCSAGVGRTGTFIAIDSLMQQSHSNTKLDVRQTAARLRHDRTTMIQTQSQYRLVYEAVLEAYTSRDCRTDVTSLGKVLTSEVVPSKPNQYTDAQFEKLQQAKVLATKPDYTTAESEENINKNRDISVLPDENHMVYLTYYVRGRNQYINAVFTTTFFRRRGCILTQLPFQHTAVDLWRLVAGNGVKTVVSLGSASDSDHYWPLSGKSVMYGPFDVSLTSQTPLGDHLTSYSLLLAPEDGEQSNVRLLHYSAWGGELPDDLTDLLQLLHVLTEEDARDTGPAPVVLQCRDGATRSGLLRALADVINRVTSDGDVDVFADVKHVHNVRPHCVMSQTQYRYVFHVLQRYMDINMIYQNT